jgi:long-chain acyl-CoA synthetase
VLVPDHIARAAKLYPGAVAAICEGEHRTHREIDERSNRLANALLERGLAKGERVVVLLENSIRGIEIDFALGKAGLVRVSLNPRVTASELAYILDDAEPAAMIFGTSFTRLVEPALAARETIRVAIRIDEPDAQACGYEALIEGGAPHAPAVEIAEEDLYSLAYTSGSTGKPKGVMLTHRAIVQVAYNVLLEFPPEAPGEKVLLLQPLSHGAGYFVLAYYMRGCTVVLMRQFAAQRALELTRDLGIETVKLVPTMLQRMLALPGIDTTEFPRLRQFIYGGSHVATEVLRRAIGLFGSRLAQHYGQTEAPSTITVLPRDAHTLENLEAGVLVSAGRPFTTVDVRVVDETGRTLRPGEVGELTVRAPHAMAGYWKRDDLTAAAVRDGWLLTNDLARLDARGYVYLLGRKDEMIISGGFNIAPREVEDALCTHPAVSEACVFAKPDAEWGQAVVAVVSLRDPAASEAQLVEYTRSVLGYKRPKSITIVRELPKNPNGKIDKPALKRAYGGA